MTKFDPQWIVGFTDGEGCFHIGISKNDTYVVGYQVLLEFTITQHKKDEKLLNNIKNYFNCGVVRFQNEDIMCYRVRNFNHILEIIIPFFEKHHLKTLKYVDFQRFRRVALLIEKNDHLTKEGLEKIRNIKGEKLR